MVYFVSENINVLNYIVGRADNLMEEYCNI